LIYSIPGQNINQGERDLDKDEGNIFKSVFFVFIFTAMVGILDEGFQKLLPWRVCDIKNIITNTLSAIMGIGLFLSVRKK
jgi:VanZ family protein